MSDIGEEKLVLYAQMANLVNLLLPSLEINIKEITQNFSKVFVIYIYIFLWCRILLRLYSVVFVLQ